MTPALRKLLLATGLLALAAGTPYAQAAAATALTSATATTENAARVTVLDKQTNRREQIVLLSGQTQTVGNIDVKLTRCLPDYAARLGQDVAWLDITDNAEALGRSSAWFSGWMFNTYPEVSTLDHPRYDAILQGCGVNPRKIIQTVGAAPVIETEEVIFDTETAPETSGANGTDPFTVPGVTDASTPTEPESVTESQPEVQPEAQPEVQPEAQPAPQTEPQPEPQPQAQPQSAPEPQQDLHQLMDGTY